MNCQGPSSVFDLLDSQAGESEAADLSSHQEECADCRSRNEFYSQLRQQIRSSHQEQPALPELSRLRILKAIQAEAAQVEAPAAASPAVAPTVTAASAVPAAPAASTSNRPQRPLKVWGTGLAAAAGFVLFSSIALWQGPASSSTQLATALVQDHSRCCGSHHHAGAAHPDADPVQVAQTSFGKAPEVANFPALSQVDCKVCPLEGGHRALHVVYKHPSNQVVSMFGMPSENQNDLDLPESSDSVQAKVLSESKHPVVAWRHNGWIYSLVSEIAPTQLAQLARDGRYLARSPQQQRYAMPTQGLPVRSPYDGLAQPASYTR